MSAGQGVDVPHIPFVWHCSIAPVPAHVEVPSAHVPVHDAVVPDWEQMLGHAEVFPHSPMALQSWTPLPLHVDWPGAQLPLQPRPFRQVWLAHAEAVPQVPVSSQIWALLPTHWTVWGRQLAQVPGARQTGVGSSQVVCVVQLPVSSQLWMALPRQRVSPEPHGPASAPASEPPLPPIPPVVVVPPEPVTVEVVPPPKPPYWGKPHEVKTASEVMTNAAVLAGAASPLTDPANMIFPWPSWTRARRAVRRRSRSAHLDGSERLVRLGPLDSATAKRKPGGALAEICGNGPGEEGV